MSRKSPALCRDPPRCLQFNSEYELYEHAHADVEAFCEFLRYVTADLTFAGQNRRQVALRNDVFEVRLLEVVLLHQKAQRLARLTGLDREVFIIVVSDQVADQIERTPGRAETLRAARAVLVALGMDPG